MIDMGKLAERIQKTYKDKNKAKLISTGSNIKTPTEDSDFVLMPEWFQTMSATKGLPFGYIVQIAGSTDSGKTSCCIQATKAAQEQGVAVIYVDTERKTTERRLVQWGVNPDQMALVRPNYLEEMYDGIQKWIDAIKDADPDQKILVIIDSLGNTASQKEVEVDVDDTMQLGVAAKTNKRGLRRLVPRLEKDQIAMLVINQVYNNLGSPGKSNTGGTAIDYYSSLTYQTGRVKWLEAQEKGEKVRKGARVKWTLYKNHLIDVDTTILKQAQIDITSDGMKLVE